MPEFYVPNESRVTINMPVSWFSLGVSLLTGIVFGLVPALQMSKAGCHRRAGGRPQHRRRRARGPTAIPWWSWKSRCRWSCWSAPSLTVRTFFVLQKVRIVSSLHTGRPTA